MATALLFMSTAEPCPKSWAIVNSLVAKTRRPTSEAGKVEQAKDGTLFLDEIGEMTLEMQDKVLRLLERAHV